MCKMTKILHRKTERASDGLIYVFAAFQSNISRLQNQIKFPNKSLIIWNN